MGNSADRVMYGVPCGEAIQLVHIACSPFHRWDPSFGGQTRDCPANAPCQLKADVLFRFGRPVIVGDTATVKVAFWWAGRPEWRDPTPMRIVELTLAHSDRVWIVIDDRTLMVSGITPLIPVRQGPLAGSLSSESDSA
jgi:hypothetical protein